MFGLKTKPLPAMPEESLPPDAAPYMIRQTGLHRWQLLKLYPTKDGLGCYSYPFPSAGNCVTRQEAEAWLKREVTGEYLTPEDWPRTDECPYYHAHYGADGTLLKEEGAPTIPICQADPPRPKGAKK